MIHTSICIQLTRMLQAAGLSVKREMAVPELAHVGTELPNEADDADPRELENAKDAIMDVIASLRSAMKCYLTHLSETRLPKGMLVMPFHVLALLRVPVSVTSGRGIPPLRVNRSFHVWSSLLEA